MKKGADPRWIDPFFETRKRPGSARRRFRRLEPWATATTRRFLGRCFATVIGGDGQRRWQQIGVEPDRRLGFLTTRAAATTRLLGRGFSLGNRRGRWRGFEPLGAVDARLGAILLVASIVATIVIAVALGTVLPLRTRLTLGARLILAILTLSIVALGTILTLRPILTILALAFLAIVTAIAVVAAIAIAIAIILARAIVVLLVVAIALVIAALVALIGDPLALALDAGDGLAVVVIILLVLVERLAVLATRLLEARARLGEHTEIMIRELEVIFGVHPIALHLRIAGEILVFLEQLRGIATCATVDAVAVILTTRVTTLRALLLPATAATAAGLTIVDQLLLSSSLKTNAVSCSEK
jgi:hypothetical protein